MGLKRGSEDQGKSGCSPAMLFGAFVFVVSLAAGCYCMYKYGQNSVIEEQNFELENQN
jgi:hypothetical protein